MSGTQSKDWANLVVSPPALMFIDVVSISSAEPYQMLSFEISKATTNPNNSYPKSLSCNGNDCLLFFVNEDERKMYMLIEGIGTVITAAGASSAYSSMKAKTTAFLSYDSFWPSAVASGRSMSSRIYNVDGSLTLFFAIDAYKIQYEYG